MTQQVAMPAPAPQVARRPTKLMADLTAAILATTETARDRALATVDADATQVTEAIRAASTEGAEAIRRRSEGDLAAIKEWSKTEIARVREETEGKIGARKATLESELASHSAAVEHRVGEVEKTVAQYRSDMDLYFGNLVTEDDPARLATMAEAMPEPPELDALANLTDMDVTGFAPVEVVEPDVATPGPEAEVEPFDGSEAVAEVEPFAASAWGTSDNAWGTPAAQITAGTAEADVDDVPRWVASDTPDGFTPTGEHGDPVDRGAIMAALEAAAEAVVAAESAAESADQAEAAAGVAETAAELLVGRVDTDEETEEAQAAMSARVDAGGFETQSFTDRLASLMPGHGEGAADGEPRTTQVIVSGLVSVASIASFKRHLGRLAGVQSVGVASGPDGEFVFNVGHRPDVSFRDVIPSMPGFAARVTGTDDGVVHVTARDPESEG
ncbi:MAG: hypothetical protein ACYC65_02020 [Candidatus Limnocylindrales bacterium]